MDSVRDCLVSRLGGKKIKKGNNQLFLHQKVRRHPSKRRNCHPSIRPRDNELQLEIFNCSVREWKSGFEPKEFSALSTAKAHPAP